MSTTGQAALAHFEPHEIQPQQASSVAIATAETRAIAEVQAAMAIAKRFPRDKGHSITLILQECSRYALASTALYSYTRGGATVTGPSIKLAEVIAQQWGNIDFGVTELERRDGVSLMKAYAWDLETNTRSVKTFEVWHLKKAYGELKDITDPRDIYEHVANMTARRMRACIFQIVPRDVVDAAVAACERTLSIGEVDQRGKAIRTPAERLAALVAAFDRVGVSVWDIEGRLGKSMEALTPAEIVELGRIWTAIDNDSTQRDVFFGEDAQKARDPDAAFKDQPPPAEVNPPTTADDAPSTPDPSAGAPAEGGEYVPGADEDEPEPIHGQLGESHLRGQTVKAFSENGMETIDEVRRKVGSVDRKMAIAILAECSGIAETSAAHVLDWVDREEKQLAGRLLFHIASCLRPDAVDDAFMTITGGLESFHDTKVLELALEAADPRPGDNGATSERRELLGNYGIAP